MAADTTRHFRAQFWTASIFRGQPLFPAYRDLRCPECSANPAWLEPWPRVCASFILPLRDDLRPVVFRSIDGRGHEHYRYPARNDAPARESEERIDFPTLRSMEVFLKEQNPSYRDWQVPLNDLLDYDESHIDIPACDDHDPEAASDAAAVQQLLDEGGDFGILDHEPDGSEIRMSLAGSLSSKS